MRGTGVVCVFVVLLALYLALAMAYLRDTRQNIGSEKEKRLRKYSLICVYSVFPLLLIGVTGMAILGNDVGWEILFSSWIIVAFLSIAAAVVGAGAGGWTRIVTLTFSSMLFAFLAFSMSRCDL
jgi:hypothetical protein